MVREFVISIYLFFFKIIFHIFSWFPLKNKITFVVSFGDNSWCVYEELKRQNVPVDVVFLKSKKSKLNIPKDEHVKVYSFETYQLFDTFLSIYHLATSKIVFVDNYFGFLSAVQFKKDVMCIQLWHASGAIKQFGLYDPSNDLRTKRAIIRFQKVYRQFHKIITGSENMGKIFMEAFAASEDNLLPSGIPRTDVFFNEEKIAAIKQNLYDHFPLLKDKKVILYAPTYRDEDFDRFTLKLDVEKMYEQLAHKGYVLIIRLHPAIKYKREQTNLRDFVIDLSDYQETTDLLFITDILISDYSSVPFEFSLLEKPMIFYPYDLDDYLEERGFWEDYTKFVPGPIAFTTDEIIEILERNDFDFEKIKEFKREWNEYSTGQSSANIVQFIQEKLGVSHEYISES